MCALSRNIYSCHYNENFESNPNLEENEESPESEEKADPAEELDESVGIVGCWMMINHTTGKHHLNNGEVKSIGLSSKYFLTN